jgi:hypothetical protein
MSKQVDQAEESHHRSDALSNSSLTKPERESLPTGLQTTHKEAIAPDNSFGIEVEASNNTITVRVARSCRIFGTNNQDSNCVLLQQVLGFVPTHAGSKHALQNSKHAIATINGISPKDELEGLLAVQMIGVHNLAVECLRRASLKDQTTEGMDLNIQSATKLLRTFTAQMEALNRHRGKLGQQMVVGNVNVNDGGQAIVGTASRDSRGNAPTADDTDKVE